MSVIDENKEREGHGVKGWVKIRLKKRRIASKQEMNRNRMPPMSSSICMTIIMTVLNVLSQEYALF